MAAEYFDFYSSVADRLLPFLRGRQVAIEQRFPRSQEITYRRHTGGRGDDTWIRIRDREELNRVGAPTRGGPSCPRPF